MILNLGESNILNLDASQEKHEVAPGCRHLPIVLSRDNGFFHTEIFGGELCSFGRNRGHVLWMETLA